jgi:transposase
MEHPMPQLNDLSRSLFAVEQNASDRRHRNGPVELAGRRYVPGIERQPLKKLALDRDALQQLLHRWRKEATQAGRKIKRIAVAYEAGRDGF